MRIVIPIAATVPATAAFVVAFLMQPSPATAQRICGGTPLEVSVQVRERRHAERVARALWRNCAQRYYGDEWDTLGVARQKTEVLCYDARAWRRHYRSEGVVTCPGSEIRHPSWVCFYRATPCRYRPDSDD